MSAPRPILLTGASGFLGRMLREALAQQHEVVTLGRSAGQDLQVDLSLSIPDFQGYAEGFSRVVHNAGKAHLVPRTAAERQAFQDVNRDGTRHLLEGLDRTEAPPEQVVLISTVAVYGEEEGMGISEDHPLEGRTPYAQSKIAAEGLVRDWCQERGVAGLILRLPLVVGPQPPGNLGAMLRAIRRGRYPRVRGNVARKSAVLGADVARLIARLRGNEAGVYNLTDGRHPTFEELEEAIAASVGKGLPWTIPPAALRLGARVGDALARLGLPFPLQSGRLRKLTADLTFDDTRAREDLGWEPRPVAEAIRSGLLIRQHEKH